MKRLLAVALLLIAALAVMAVSPCTLYNQSGCAAIQVLGVGANTYNPTLSAMLLNNGKSLQSISSSIAGTRQHAVTLAGQNWPCEGAEMSTSVALNGPYCVQYATLMAQAGATTQNYNLWQLAEASSYEYSLAPGAGAYDIPGDCPSGQTHSPYLMVNETPLGNSTANPHCWALHYYDLTFAYMTAHGLTIHAGDPQLSDELQACGLGSSPWVAGTIASPVITIAQFQACISPLHAAAIKRWPAISRFTELEEPTAGMSGVQVFSVSDISGFLVYETALLKAVNNNGLTIGASGTGLSWPQQFDDAYWFDWTNPASATYAALDFYVIDLFQGNCTPGLTNTTFPGQYYYAAEMAAVTGPFGGTDAGPHGFVTRAHTTGKPLDIGQTDAPFWCPASGLSYQSKDILGQYDILWSPTQTGLFNAWLSTMIPWAGANSIREFSPFFTAPLFFYSSNQAADNAAIGSQAAALAGLAINGSSRLYALLSRGARTNIQGVTAVTGKATIP